jgi:glycerophosphoryl diester phosphodiesterase
MPFTKLLIDPPVFAHRGASQYAPENTMAAFRKAHSLGIRWLEFDVMLSADNQVVVIHDETLDRTTPAKGMVDQFTYDDLKALDAGSWFDAKFAGQKIPLLSEVIQFMREHDMSANIEIKALPGKEELTAKLVLDVIRDNWTSSMLPPLISSFSLEILRAVRHLDSDCYIGLLMDEWMSDWEALCEELNCISVHPNQKIMDSEKAALIKSSKRFIFCYTVNDPLRARELFSWGVDAVYSDCPDKVLLGI